MHSQTPRQFSSAKCAPAEHTHITDFCLCTLQLSSASPLLPTIQTVGGQKIDEACGSLTIRHRMVQTHEFNHQHNTFCRPKGAVHVYPGRTAAASLQVHDCWQHQSEPVIKANVPQINLQPGSRHGQPSGPAQQPQTEAVRTQAWSGWSGGNSSQPLGMAAAPPPGGSSCLHADRRLLR